MNIKGRGIRLLYCQFGAWLSCFYGFDNVFNAFVKMMNLVSLSDYYDVNELI